MAPPTRPLRPMIPNNACTLCITAAAGTELAGASFEGTVTSWFPVLSGFFSLLFGAALLVPTWVLQIIAQSSKGHQLVVGPLQYAVLFVTYFGLSFIATF